MRCRTCRFLHVGAAYHCTCSMRQWNSYDFRIPLWRPTSAAGCCSAVLTGGRIAPGAITHAVRSVVIVCRSAVPAGTSAPVLTGRILLPASITVTMAAGVNSFALGLTASAGVRTVAVAGTGGSLLILEDPCVAAAVRTSAGTIAASAVALIGVSAKVLDVVAEITLIIVCMAARRMCDFDVCSLE